MSLIASNSPSSVNDAGPAYNTRARSSSGGKSVLPLSGAESGCFGSFSVNIRPIDSDERRCGCFAILIAKIEEGTGFVFSCAGTWMITIGFLSLFAGTKLQQRATGDFQKVPIIKV